MKVKRGDIIWVDLGEISEVVGHEQAKLRPCVVIKDFNNLQLSLVLPLTSKHKPFYSVVKIEKEETGMDEDSFALCHQLRTISHHRIKSKAGSLSERSFNRIRGVLNDIISS